MRAAFHPLRTLRGWCAEIRDIQLDHLAEAQRLDAMGALDAAVQQHMAQPAMWTADPLTDHLKLALQDPLTDHLKLALQDPLTDHLKLALQDQLAAGGPVWPDEAGAPEGLHPRCTAGAGLTPQQWQALAATHAEGLGSAWWLLAGITALAVVGAFFHFYPMGWAA